MITASAKPVNVDDVWAEMPTVDLLRLMEAGKFAAAIALLDLYADGVKFAVEPEVAAEIDPTPTMTLVLEGLEPEVAETVVGSLGDVTKPLSVLPEPGVPAIGANTGWLGRHPFGTRPRPTLGGVLLAGERRARR